LAEITMGQPCRGVQLWTARRALAKAGLSANVGGGDVQTSLRSVTMMILLALCSAAVSA